MNRPAVTLSIKKMIHQHFPDVKALLYGSKARGDARPDSDFDLLFLLPDSLSRTEFNRVKYDLFDKIYDIEIDKSVNISALILQHKDWNLRKTPFTVNVNNDALTLGKNHSDYTYLRPRAEKFIKRLRQLIDSSELYISIQAENKE